MDNLKNIIKSFERTVSFARELPKDIPTPEVDVSLVDPMYVGLTWYEDDNNQFSMDFEIDGSVSIAYRIGGCTHSYSIRPASKINTAKHKNTIIEKIRKVLFHPKQEGSKDEDNNRH